MTTGEYPRGRAATARLARLGFTDAESAARLLTDPVIEPLTRDDAVLDALSATADPGLALTGLIRLAEAASDRDALIDALSGSGQLRDRLLGVLGVSSALGDHLARHPADWHALTGDAVTAARPSAYGLRRALLAAVDVAGPQAAAPRAGLAGAEGRDALRVDYRRCLIETVARDLSGAASMEDVAAELADLACATLEAALAIARAELPADAPPCRLAVIGLGKCGGRELNYVSDVDVVFVAEPHDVGAPAARAAAAPDERAALDTANRLAAAMMRVCSEPTAEGTIWPVDAALRPEGKAGPLARTLASHLAYYERWAKTWEFQALLKARPVAGDLTLGRRYVDAVAPLVWRAADRAHFVEDVQEMRQRVEESISRGEASRQLKLGPGGLRDVEFSVQLLQLVHGRTDASLRSGNTIAALTALARGGYVGRADAGRLEEAYRFLRTLEHRMQLHRLRRLHVVPGGDDDLRRIGRSLGFRRDPAGQFDAAWLRHALEVRRLHEKLFYRPLLASVARLPTDESRLTPEAARARLEALGYGDPAAALRHIEALCAGVTRRAAIQRTLLPVLLGWFAGAADPDGGLLAFRQVSDSLGATPWYLRLLRDEGAAAERIARILATSRFATDLILRAPDAVAMLGDDEQLRPRGRDALETEILAAVRRASDPQSAVTVTRAVRRRELFRIAAADLSGRLDEVAAGEALTDVTAATLAGALEAARRAVTGDRTPPTRLAVIAMGRFGGHELGYGSDADVIFVHDPEPGADERAASEAAYAVANELRRLLQLPGTDPPLVVDTGLRPEGRQGPLARTLASYARYYERWSQIWESQALLRAEPVAGDRELGKRFLRVIDALRWPQGGLSAEQVREIRRIKARVESERLPRGADPTTHTKLGRGGLADIEWTVQLLQLRHGARVPALRTTRTLPALHATVGAGLLDAEDADVLESAWRMASRIRNAVMLVRGRPSDVLPSEVRELGGVARYLGYGPADTGDMIEDYRRVARRARAVVERIFYT
ncbi:MAG: bifunctional [glutamine synthetase] adenylyltransferase/[glutamine synthetase]-adenylyl-L-tyrosine phosphorylase [Carbonactinosporaceae bacterium]